MGKRRSSLTNQVAPVEAFRQYFVGLLFLFPKSLVVFSSSTSVQYLDQASQFV
jgi:hypothetical protein